MLRCIHVLGAYVASFPLPNCFANVPSLMQVHRRDCEISSLVAQVAHLEASAAGSARHAAEAEVRRGGGQGRGAAVAYLCCLVVRDRGLAPRIALC